jgi:hypothetical protein
MLSFPDSSFTLYFASWEHVTYHEDHEAHEVFTGTLENESLDTFFEHLHVEVDQKPNSDIE